MREPFRERQDGQGRVGRPSPGEDTRTRGEQAVHPQNTLVGVGELTHSQRAGLVLLRSQREGVRGRGVARFHRLCPHQPLG